MPISLNNLGLRPTAEQKTTFLNPPSFVGVVTEDDTNDKWLLTISDTVNPAPFDISAVSITSGSDTLTGAVGLFKTVKPGDPISGTGIPVGTTVLSLNPECSEMVISDAASASNASGTVSFDPPSRTDIIALVEVTATGSAANTNVTFSAKIYANDGTLEETMTVDNAPIKPASTVSQTIDWDKVQTNRRDFRV